MVNIGVLSAFIIINFVGINAYVRRKGFNDPVILEFATGLIAHWEVCPQILIDPSNVSSQFISGICGCLRNLEPVEVNRLSEDDSQFTIWAEVLKIHHILRR